MKRTLELMSSIFICLDLDESLEKGFNVYWKYVKSIKEFYFRMSKFPNDIIRNDFYRISK